MTLAFSKCLHVVGFLKKSAFFLLVDPKLNALLLKNFEHGLKMVWKLYGTRFRSDGRVRKEAIIKTT